MIQSGSDVKTNLVSVMRPRFQYIFSLLFTLLPAAGLQAQEVDSLMQETDAPSLELQSHVQHSTDSLDSLVSQPVDTSKFIKLADIYLDYGKLVTMPFSFETKAEMGIGMYFRFNFGLNVEAGYGAKYPEDAYKNSDYSVKGYYGRIGLNYHYTYAPGVHLYLGAKYGYSMYEDGGTYELGSDTWGNYSDSFKRTNLQANWFEIIGGSERRWKGNFYLGFVVRVRVLMNYDTFTPIDVYAIPGYGRTMDKSIPALNLYIKYIFGNRIGGAKEEE